MSNMTSIATNAAIHAGVTAARHGAGVSNSAEAGPPRGATASGAPAITLLLDGACPLCRREGRYMERLDGGRGRVAFVDIAAPGFDASRYGRTQAQVMGAIHGVLPDGSIVTGLEVFRHAYTALGRGWMVAWTAWPVLRPIADAGYRLFAKVRPRLPGRHGCEGGACRVP